MSDQNFPQENNDNEDSRFQGGRFLVSETELTDPNFFRTVVLVVDHNEQGAFGLVVNRPSQLSLGDLISELEDSPAGEIPVYVGGPVEQEYLFVLHSEMDEPVEQEHETAVAPSLIFSPLTVQMVLYLKDRWNSLPENERPEVRIYAGYSGWGEGQLEFEIEHDSWVSVQATADIVFNENPEEDWRTALSRKNEFYRIVAQTGFKPSMN